jgi:hypothetical protein
MDSTVALLVGLLGGGTIGAIVTALLTVSHQRSERFRDRQFEAASGFTADYEAALDSVIEFWEAATNVADSKLRVGKAVPAATKANRETIASDVLVELSKAINVGLDLVGRDVSTERATEEIARSRAIIEQAIENLSGQMEEPFASTHRELLRAMEEASVAIDRFGRAGCNTTIDLHRSQVRVAQLNLLFAGEDTEVVEGARLTLEALVAIGNRVLVLLQARLDESDEDAEDDGDTGLDSISDDIQDANERLARFAALANQRVRPRPLARDLL